MALSKTFPKDLNEDNGNAENQFDWKRASHLTTGILEKYEADVKEAIIEFWNTRDT